MKIYAWNTGALYTQYGQRIGTAELPDGGVYFEDVDRGIDGLVPAQWREGMSAREAVTTAYLRGGCEYWRGTFDVPRDIKQAARAAARALRGGQRHEC